MKLRLDTLPSMRLLICIALVPVLACVDAPEAPGAPPGVEPIAKPCVGGCGLNGAVVDGVPFSWLRLDGEPNDDGVTYLEFAINNQVRKLDIDGHFLRYRAGAEWRMHHDLIGGVIRIAIADKKYNVTIVDVNYKKCSETPSSGVWGCTEPGEPYWTAIDSGDAETYRLRWSPADDHNRKPEEVCPTIPVDLIRGTNSLDAVAFEGEHYAPDTRLITETATGNNAPFNIACLGSLPAKQELTRRTSASKFDVYQTTIDDDRQALTRVWAAEYCLGSSFTHQSHRLRVRDRHGWMYKGAPLGWLGAPFVGLKFPAKPAIVNFNYEAVWNANGAVCLDVARLAVADPNVPPEADIWSRIEAECGALPPPCTGQPWFPHDWKSHGDFLTATVAPVAFPRPAK